MGLKGNPVRDGSGPAAVILIPQVRNKNLYYHATFPMFRDGKAGRGQESQKTSLSNASQKAFVVRGCEDKGFGFYPPAFKTKAGVFIFNHENYICHWWCKKR